MGWPFKHSPYGPLFTLGSYALAPLGLAGGLWALKAIAALASLGAIALVGYAAHTLGRQWKWAVAFVGLNPVLLELAVGGAHNDTLVMASLAAALALAARGQARERAGGSRVRRPPPARRRRRPVPAVAACARARSRWSPGWA